MEALRQHMEQQERDRLLAGELWQEHGLVFASRVGTPLSANNVIRAFRIITKKAGLGEDWVPREMRHTFVSVLSANGVPVESIALLAGHERTATTESVYRHEIRPALTQGAEVMEKIFGSDGTSRARIVRPNRAGYPGGRRCRRCPGAGRRARRSGSARWRW